MRAPYSLREALADCRSHIIESGESPPGRGGAMDLLIAADAAVRDALPALVGRYKSAGALTWEVLYKIEADVLAHLAATGEHPKRVLDVIRAPAERNHPRDERPASFEGHDLVPVVFQAIEEAWRRLDKGDSLASIDRCTSDMVTKERVANTTPVDADCGCVQKR